MANLNVKQLFTNILNKLKSHDNKIGDTTMGTTATTITGAIAEHETDISNLNSKLIKSASFSGTTDGTGRITIEKSIDKIVSVHLYSTANYCYVRYLNDSQTLVYVRDAFDNNLVANTTIHGVVKYLK